MPINATEGGEYTGVVKEAKYREGLVAFFTAHKGKLFNHMECVAGLVQMGITVKYNPAVHQALNALVEQGKIVKRFHQSGRVTAWYGIE